MKKTIILLLAFIVLGAAGFFGMQRDENREYIEKVIPLVEKSQSLQRNILSNEESFMGFFKWEQIKNEVIALQSRLMEVGITNDRTLKLKSSINALLKCQVAEIDNLRQYQRCERERKNRWEHFILIKTKPNVSIHEVEVTFQELAGIKRDADNAKALFESAKREYKNSEKEILILLGLPPVI